MAELIGQNTIGFGSPKKTETKNGMAFDLILEVPKTNTPAKLTPHNTPNRILTNEDIKNKLLKAEERRQSLEMMKLKEINETTTQRLEHAAKVRAEQDAKFSKQTQQKINMKMESNKENREQIMQNLMDKLKKTDEKIVQIKELTAQTTQMLDDRIKNKLISAEENRTDKLKSIIEKLKEHERHAEEVRGSIIEEKDNELEEKIINKLDNALQYREGQLEKIKEKIREHEKHANEVREKANQMHINENKC